MVWLIEGPFDGQTPGEIEHKKTKLLKCGRSYLLGRKAKTPTMLVINSPKISSQHISITVGEHSVQDVADVTRRPVLTIHNSRNKPIHLRRKGVITPINASTDIEAEDGDKVALVSGVSVEIRWTRIACYISPKNPPIAHSICAELGLKVLSVHSGSTHRLTPHYSFTPSMAISLVSKCHFVRPEWLTEYLRLGEEVKESGSDNNQHLTVLESEFVPPSEVKFRPSFSPALPPDLKTFQSWEPNDGRSHLFQGWRFIFVNETNREADSELKEIVEQGKGEYNTFDISSGPTRWKQFLSRHKRKVDEDGGKGISIIASVSGIQTAAGAQWDEISGLMKSYGLRFIERSQLVEAAFYVDTSKINSSSGVDIEEVNNHPLVRATPNLVPDEISRPSSSSPNESILVRGPSVEQVADSAPSRPKLIRRAKTPSGATTPAPEAAPVPNMTSQVTGEASSLPRKPLIRRARAAISSANTLLGVDDPSVIESQPPLPAKPDTTAETGQPVGSDIQSPVGENSTRPTRLKRRARTENPYNPILQGLEKELEVNEQAPPLKKFKALFDESNPDRVTQDLSTGTQIYSQISSRVESVERHSVMNVPATQSFPAVREEVEESQSAVASAPSGDIDMHDVEDRAEDVWDNESARTVPPSKTFSKDDTNATRAPPSTKPTSSRSGIPAGEPDKDEAFLKALASSKRGKKKEDDFDREFNNLRISKPEREKDDQAKQWSLLDDFEMNDNLKGNFMVIVEMDVPEKQHTSKADEVMHEQSRKPDFKKFKKKSLNREKPSVELILTDENDYGMGSAYWKGGSQSQSQSQDTDGLSLLQPSQTQNRKFLQPLTQKVGTSKMKNQTRGQSSEQERTMRSGSRTIESEDEEPVKKSLKKRSKLPTALFLRDDDDLDVPPSTLEEDEDLIAVLDDPESEEGRPRWSRGASSKVAEPTAPAESKRKRRPAEVLDDDSDTGVAFKGFGGRKKTRTL